MAGLPVFEYADYRAAISKRITLRQVGRRLPYTLARAFRLGWAVDRAAVVWMVGCQVLAAGLAAAGVAATSAALGHLLASGAVPDRIHAAAPAIIAGSCTAAARALADTASRAAAARLVPKAAREADMQLIEACLHIEYDTYDRPGFRADFEGAERGSNHVDLLMKSTQSITSSLAQLAGASVMMAVLSPVLFPLLALAAAPLAWASVQAARAEYETWRSTLGDLRLRRMLRWYATDPDVAAEARTGTVAPYLTRIYRQVSERMESALLVTVHKGLRLILAGEALAGIALAGTWAALAWLAYSGSIAPAAAGTAVMAIRTINGALVRTVQTGTDVFRQGLYLDDWAAFLDDCREQQNRRGTLTVKEPPAVIACRDVTYTYPGTGAAALDGITLELRRGETLALVGENGSGKTTLTRILTGLSLPTSGSIRWDGIDLADAQADSVWEHVALVPQEWANWPFHARENVSLGRVLPGGDAAVWEAARRAGAAEVIETLPKGLDHLLGKEGWGGQGLSGGQWQRIAIARAFYRPAGLLVLDEPTSALDARAEHHIFRQLREHAPDRCTVLVTHRIENTRIADRIVVMQRGRIAQQGTYEQLLAAPGLFAELHALSQDR
ncbi:hypothetical protein VR41_09265 [Streptomyces sp. NRRL B-1568]|nr:hypothetical protein VR41_09265 [Streptomyces sp. NRRL B-1568]